MYLWNSHPRRVLPIPATPTNDTSRARRSRAVACSSSLRMRISASRPTNGGSSASLRFAPPRMATTRSARHALTGSSLPLRTFSPAGSKVMATDAARIVPSSTSRVPGGAADWRREAVLTMSPATMPCPVAPIVTAASPVVTPARS